MMIESAHGNHVSISARDIPLCQRFPEKHLPCLLPEGREESYSVGQLVVKPGQSATHAYVVLEGSAAVRLSSPSGAAPLSAVLKLLGPGDLYGLVQALDGRSYTTGLEALTETRVLAVPRDAFLEELDHHPETAHRLLVDLAAMVRTVEEWLLTMM